MGKGQDGAAGENGVWQFPDEPITAESLTGAYQDYLIHSYSRQHGFRSWDGRRREQTAAAGYGMVGRDAMGAAMFPPLAVERSEWSAPWHPFDEFFALPQAELAVVGEERLGDGRVYVLEHDSEVTFKASWLLPEEIEKYGDRARRFPVVRA